MVEKESKKASRNPYSMEDASERSRVFEQNRKEYAKRNRTILIIALVISVVVFLTLIEFFVVNG